MEGDKQVFFQASDLTSVQLPLDINDEDITTRGLRCSPRSNQHDPLTTMTSALHATKLRQLWSKFNDNIYPASLHPSNEGNPNRGVSIETLRQELEDWRATIPDQSTDVPASQKTMSVFASTPFIS